MRSIYLPPIRLSATVQVFATLLLASMIVLAIGCSEPTEPSNTPFAILAISEDSVFAEDQFVVTVDKDLGKDSIKLFIGTLRCQLDSVVGKNVYARAIAGDGRYRVRMYANDVEASGDFFLYLFNRSISKWGKRIVRFEPFEGNVGDTIAFWIDSTSIDVLTLNPNLHGVPLDFLRMQGKQALYTIPDAAQDGPMRVRIYDRDVELYPFDVIRPETDLPFEEAHFSSIELALGAIGHIIKLHNDGSVEQYDMPMLVANFSIGPSDTASVRVTDSFRVDQYINRDRYLKYCNVRIYFDPLTRLLSGKISFSSATPDPEYDVYHIQSMDLEFKDLAWYKENGAYVLYATSDPLAHLTDLKLRWGDDDEPLSILGTYEPYDPYEDSFFRITIR